VAARPASRRAGDGDRPVSALVPHAPWLAAYWASRWAHGTWYRNRNRKEDPDGS
jgi:hypothetical protein